jgi:hypothetical protein
VLSRALADKLGLTIISTCNDRHVISGQDTLGREILEQIDRRPHGGQRNRREVPRGRAYYAAGFTGST